MASNTLGFAIIVIVILIASVPLAQSIGLSVQSITSSQSEQVDRQTTILNQDLSIDVVNNTNSADVTINNTGSEEINAQRLTLLFDNTVLSIDDDGLNAEISGDSYPDNRTFIPTGESLNVTFTEQPEDRVRVVTGSGVRSQTGDFSG